MARRSDWPLIKHLSKTYSPRVAWEWQRRPVVEGDGLQRFADSLTVDVLESRESGTFRFPWCDFVVSLRVLSVDTGRMLPVWVRVVEPRVWQEAIDLASPWITVSHLRHEEPPDDVSLISEAFLQTGAGIIFGPFVGCIRADETKRMLEPEVLLSQQFSTSAADIDIAATNEALNRNTLRYAVAGAAFLDYLTQCPEYLVEESPAYPQSHPRNHPKPWTFESLPRIILLDPAKAPSGEKSPYQGGTHASPRPHQRRGHWSVLKHPKFRRNEDGSIRKIFVKPAWVGPREWIMEGNRYKVIEAGVS